MNSLSYILKKIKNIADNVSDDIYNASGDTDITTTMDRGGVDFVYHIVPKHMFKTAKFAFSDEQLEKEKQTGEVKLADIFSSWKRYTHSYGPALHELDNSNSSTSTTGSWAQKQNDISDSNHKPYLDPNASGWIIDNDMIRSTVDGIPVAGFISPAAIYDNYMFRCKIDTGWDDDNNGIVVGYMKDDFGREHTLTIMRGFGIIDSHDGKIYDPGASGIDTKFWWGLIYDAGNDTQDLLINLSKTVGTPAWGSNYNGDSSTNYCYITAIRKNGTITGKTTEFSKDGSDTKDVDAWTFTYSLPDKKPSSMPQEEYNNIKKMLTGKNHIGFCVRSSSHARFSIADQDGVFPDQKLYDLTKFKTLLFDKETKEWYESKKDYLVADYNQFILSQTTNTLVYYGNDQRTIIKTDDTFGSIHSDGTQFCVTAPVWVTKLKIHYNDTNTDDYIPVQFPLYRSIYFYYSGSSKSFIVRYDRSRLHRYTYTIREYTEDNPNVDITISWSKEINNYTGPMKSDTPSWLHMYE